MLVNTEAPARQIRVPAYMGRGSVLSAPLLNTSGYPALDVGNRQKEPEQQAPSSGIFNSGVQLSFQLIFFASVLFNFSFVFPFLLLVIVLNLFNHG